LVGKPEGKKPLGRPRFRWEDNIKMDLNEVGWEVWTGSSWLRISTGGGHLKLIMCYLKMANLAETCRKE